MRTLIIGCGRVGSGLARLLNQRGHEVIVIDRDPAAFERLGPLFRGQQIVGVGFDRDVLLQAGIECSDSLAAVTASDETNVVVARLAREFFHVPKVAARLHDPAKAEIYRRLGIQTIAMNSWGVHRIADMLCYGQLDVVASLGSGAVQLVEVAVMPLLVGRRVADLTVPGELSIVAVSRSGRTFLTTSGTVFQAGDLLHLIIAADAMGRVETLLAAG